MSNKTERERHQVDKVKILDNIGDVKQNKTKCKFSVRLNELLYEKGISQQKFCRETSIATGSLSKYRNGKQEPTITNLNIIASTLGVSTDYLLGNTDEKSPEIDNIAINKRLGLSDEAISNIETMFNDCNYTGAHKAMRYLLSSCLCRDVFTYLYSYWFADYRVMDKDVFENPPQNIEFTNEHFSDKTITLCDVTSKIGKAFHIDRLNQMHFLEFQQTIMEMTHNIKKEAGNK